MQTKPPKETLETTPEEKVQNGESQAATEEPDPQTSPEEPARSKPVKDVFQNPLAELKNFKLSDIENWHVAILISVLGIVGLSLPWQWADDVAESYNAAGILMHFPTAHDKWYLVRTSPIGSMISVFAPAGIIIATLSTGIVILVKKKVSHESTTLAVTNILLIMLLMWGCKEILDPDLPRIGPFNLPQAGLSMILLSALVVAGMHLLEKYRPSTQKEN